jgi:gluconokinase
MPLAVVVVMGVSGSGKSTVGALLAGRLDWEYRDADDFHPLANVEKMRQAIPLDDDDRRPWLAAIAAWIDAKRASSGHGVVTCSALKRRYRDQLIGKRDDVGLVYLKGDFDLIVRRLSVRLGHFMPASLLQSQFAALEEPGPEERPIIVAIDPSPNVIVQTILDRLAASS